MALVVEPGGANADSYVSLVDAKAAWGNLGFDHSALSDTQLEQALRRATVWLDGRYRSQLPGSRTNGRSQALEWPRSGVYDRDSNAVASDEIPSEIVAATVEAARFEASGTTLAPTVTPGRVAKMQKVGSLAVEYAGTPTASAQRPTVLAVEDILSNLFAAGSATGFLQRA